MMNAPPRPRRLARPAACLLLAALAPTARAQNTRILFEVSSNQGASWGPRVSILPGTEAIVRVRIQHVGTMTLLGLGGITMQPTLSNWNPVVDERLPFTQSDGSGCSRDPQTNTGRIIPFHAFGMSSLAASGLLTSHVDPGNILRFAGVNAFSPTTNLAWGVSFSQLTFNLGGPPVDAVFGPDALVFRYAVRPGGTQERELTAAVELSSILRGYAGWYREYNGRNNLLAPVRPEDIIPATIHVIPAPATLPLLLLTLAAPRRRRPHS